MELKNYIETVGRANFARQLGVSKGQVSHWMQDRQIPSAQMARRIEQATGGTLTRETLRPDIFGRAA